MAVKLSSIEIATDDDGTFIPVAEWPGVRLKVRPLNSKDYQIARELLVQSLVKALGRMPTSPEMEPKLGALVARHLLRGWEGLAGDDEKPVEYSAKLALQYLTDPKYGALEAQVIWAAGRAGDREVEFTVDTVKNSAAPSAST
jgi:hypothetical protein